MNLHPKGGLAHRSLVKRHFFGSYIKKGLLRLYWCVAITLLSILKYK